MARIAGIELQDKWKVDYALTNIKGIGWALSEKILDSVGIKNTKRISDLSSEDIAKIASELEKHSTEGDLARNVRTNIQRLQQIGSYRGTRHQKGLPARGQRTRRGKRKTVGAFKKEQLVKQKQTQQQKGGKE